ncbi:Conserved_hypothetical protein [Hexamita inflata]|uniref:Uncharacterized protein n=1 Tax=Hexamita inflata TaxID=28002 RepID=A0AA86RMV3_9EUKA|nr:Conserved hypothetical protein [Hexamita inflata]
MSEIHPGDLIGSTAQLEAGEFVYTIKDQIYAATSGCISKDYIKKEVSINPYVINKVPQSGDFCVVQVLFVQRNQIETKVLQVESQKMKETYGIIRAMDKNTQKHKIGDFLLCKILTVSQRGYLLTTKEDGLGQIDVVKFQNEYQQ